MFQTNSFGPLAEQIPPYMPRVHTVTYVVNVLQMNCVKCSKSFFYRKKEKVWELVAYPEMQVCSCWPCEDSNAGQGSPECAPPGELGVLMVGS